MRAYHRLTMEADDQDQILLSIREKINGLSSFYQTTSGYPSTSQASSVTCTLIQLGALLILKIIACNRRNLSLSNRDCMYNT